MKKGMRMFGHPVHAMVVHFPMALLPTTVLWDVIGLFRGGTLWWSLSFWSTLVGLIAALPAAASGLTDYLTISAGAPQEKTALNHLIIMISAVTLFGCGLLFLAMKVMSPAADHWIAAALAAAGSLTLMTGAWFGGELVFHFGMGRQDS